MSHFKKILADSEKLCQEVLGKLEAAQRAGEWYGLDTESHGPLLESGKMLNVFQSSLTGFSVAFQDRTAYYVPIAHQEGNAPFLSAIRGYKLAFGAWAVVHSLKHEIHVYNSVAPRRWKAEQLPADSLPLCWMLDRPSSDLRKPYNLKRLAYTHLGMEMLDFQQVAGDRPWNSVKPEHGYGYACDDAIASLLLYLKFEPELTNKARAVYHETELPFAAALADIEARGMGIDSFALSEFASELQLRTEMIEDAWSFAFPNVSIGSPAQVRDYFFNNRLWPTRDVERTPTGLLSANRYAMELALKHPQTPREGRIGAELRIEYQDCKKLLSTYTHSLIAKAAQHRDGRLHPSYHHTGTRTGRISCSDPNLMQIPLRTELGRRIKAAFTPAPDHAIISSDYSQIEPRVLAHFAGKGLLFDIYQAGRDIYQENADRVNTTRQRMKTTILAYFYGAYPRKLAKVLEVELAEAERIYYGFEQANPEIVALKERAMAFARRHGFIRTIGQNIRRLPEIHSGGAAGMRAERQAPNTAVQGSAAYIVKRAMVESYAVGLPMIAQVHDEIAIEAPKQEADDMERELNRIMQEAYPLSVPLVVETKRGQTWAM